MWSSWRTFDRTTKTHLARHDAISPVPSLGQSPGTHVVNGEDAGAVLDEMLDEESPVLLMRNTVDEFIRDLKIEISERAQQVAIDDSD